MNTEYNGWANFATWNVATHLMESFYDLIYSTEGTYSDLQEILLDELGITVTPDLESYHGADLDRHALDRLLTEMRED
jgi:hypothetical protein